RVGLDGKTSQKGTYEILALFHRSDMTYDLGSQGNCRIEPWLCYATVDYYPNTYNAPLIAPIQNKDITNTWGLHVRYSQPVGTEGWKLGGIATMNYKTHPKIPNYELMNIPRDPGNSWAFDVGLGTAHISKDHVTFGTDLIVEPIWSTTWAKAQQNITNPVGTLQLPKGYKTMKNRFSFLNTIVKTGLGWRSQRMLLQTGIQAKTYRYTLKQQNFIEQTYRRQKERWTEWTFSWSIGVHFNSIDITYTGLLTTGTGQPGIVRSPVYYDTTFSTTGAGDFIFAPDGDLSLNNSNVLTNQVIVTIAI
ncbi:MAG TPA: hypothetical protein VJ964_08105, partial [Balneolaceae bacterium]|nr:hypothetical protein [Balneolaceae bacterium]